jgi:prepilin peptidase CpaA
LTLLATSSATALTTLADAAGPAWPAVAAFIAMTILLAVAAVCDTRTHTIPPWLTYPAIVAGLVFWFVAGCVAGAASDAALSTGLAFLRQSLLGFAVGLIPFAVLFLAGVLGGGDVKLLAAVGAVCASWQCVIAVAFYGFVVGALLAIVLMVRKGLVRRTLSRISAAAMQALARTKPHLDDEQSPRVPLAVGFLIGGVIAGCQYLLGVRMPWGVLT